MRLGAGKQRALLVVLLLHRGEVVSRDRLIDALWGETPPKRAGKALQVYVSKLRKLLSDPGLLVTRAPGYAFELPREALDVARFDRLCDEGRQALAEGQPEHAVALLHEGLSLWRGPPLADVAFESFAQPHIARLEEQRLAALENRIDAELQLGRHTGLIGELESHIAEHPLRERLRGQLMLALYRSGRQAEALEVYRAARMTLVEELGIEPTRALQDVQRAILAQAPELDPPQREPRGDEEPPLEPRGDISRGSAADMGTREVRKTVTVLFGVLESSAATGVLDPEALRAAVSPAYDEIRAALERHGGTIDRSAGDTVTAVFGIPLLHEDDALRAVRAAAEMRESVEALRDDVEQRWSVRLGLRIGIGTGDVVTGGTAGEQLYPSGEAVSVALRLAQTAATGEIRLAETTYRLVKNAINVEVVLPTGDAAAVPAYRLVDVAMDVLDQVRRFDSPMVGRKRERRRLEDAFQQAVGDSSCQLFTILGAPGVGKSRLVREFLDGIAGSARVARGRCLSYGEGITYWPVIEAVKDVAALDDAQTPEQRRGQLMALLEGDDEAELVAKRLAELMGLAETSSRAEESFLAVRTFFEGLARRRPLVLVFDDVHWGETTFLDLVENVADWARDSPILLVCIARPELLEARPAWGGGKWNSTSILLEPLDHDECGVLVANLLGRSELADRARSRIADAAEGNPLFVEEMLAMLIDDGLLVRDDGHWIATTDLAAVRAPPTIQSVLAARLDQLADEERRVIERASVEGKVFHEGSIVALASESAETVRASIETLVRKELIRPDRPVFARERAFRFRHLLIRDAAYASIPKRVRAVFHELHARWLEERLGDRAVEFEEIIGYHLEQAYRYRAELGMVDERARALGRSAAERLGAAGRRAFARSDASAGVNLISRAVALLPAADALRVDLVPNVRVMQGIGDLGWAEAILSEAIEEDDERLRAHALVQRGFLQLFTAPEVQPAELFEVADEAIRVFGGLGDQLGLARAWRLVAQTHYLDRSAGSCAEASERSLTHAQRAGDRFEQREIVEWLGVALWLGPTPAREGVQVCERLENEFGDDRLLAVYLDGTRAYLAAIQGQADEVSRLIDRSERAMHDADEWIWLFPVYVAMVALWQGKPAHAERRLRPAYEQFISLEEKSHFCSVATILGQAVYAQGRYDEAYELAQDAAKAARPNDVHSHIVSRGTTAKVLAQRGELGAAEELGREAVAFAEESDFLESHGGALMDLAEVLHMARREDEAHALVERALRLFEEKGNVVAASRGRDRLRPSFE